MEKEQKVKKPGNKDSLIIGIVIAVVLALTAAIVGYVFWGVGSEVVIHYKGGEVTRGTYESVYRYWAPTLAYYGYNPDAAPELVVDEILLNEVLYKEAVAAGLKITDEDQKSINDQFADKTNVEGLVAQGVDVDELKKFFEKNAVITAYLDAKQEKITTEEMKKFIIQEEGEDADGEIDDEDLEDVAGGVGLMIAAVAGLLFASVGLPVLIKYGFRSSW